MIFTRLFDRLRYLRDRAYVSQVYRKSFSRELDWDNPTRYTEKINILKISAHAKKLAKYTDKFAVRDYVASTIGPEFLVPLIGQYDRVGDIDLARLPAKFILKCTHGSGMNIICSDKATFDWDKARRELSLWMKSNFYHTFGRELQYNSIKPRIVCEEFISDSDGDTVDYKIHCFQGKPLFIRTMTGRSTALRKAMYMPDWTKPSFEFVSKEQDNDWKLPKPENLDIMLHLATLLSRPFPFVRVDLYNIAGKIYFGELTFTPAAGIQVFNPDSYDAFYGSKF